MTTDVAVAPSGLLDRVKNYAAVIGAVVGAITALWGVYEKVRSEARRDTAASYNTLAPQVNQMGEALKQLQQENQQLREIVATHQNRPRIGAVPAAKKPTPGRPPSKAPAAAAAAAPAADAGAPAATAPVAAPAATATTPVAPDEAPPGEKGDPVGDLLSTVGKTRAAIETLRRVPEDFGRVVKEKADNKTPEKPEGSP
jgi:hypothetical protein